MSKNKRHPKIIPPKLEVEKVKIGVSEVIDYPIFCFRHLVLMFDNDYKFYFNFIDRLVKLSSLNWNQINASDRHSFGTEKIPIGQIKPALPRFVTPDVRDLIVFRAVGDNRPFLGIRNGNVFHVIFIEEKFGYIYNH